MINSLILKINQKINNDLLKQIDCKKKDFYLQRKVLVSLTISLTLQLIGVIGGVFLFLPLLQKAQAAPVWLEDPQYKKTIINNDIINTYYDYIKISVDSITHNDYGLAYPITYEFSIPIGSFNLKAYKRYSETQRWIQIPEKTSSDFFNGIEAVRFDYPNNRAYISVAFDPSSDEIHLKVTNAWGQIVNARYLGITDYYDNRDAVVTVTADDWDGYNSNNTKFQNACDAFTSRNIWFTVGIITQGIRKNNWPAAVWNDIQSKINAGYIEPASHSREHLGYVYSYHYTGTHTGPDNKQYTMTDSTAKFPVDSPSYSRNLVGWKINNTTDGSSCIITSNNATSITCSAGLSGEIDNDWDNRDTYVIDRYDEEIGDSKTEITDNLDLPALNKKNSSEYVYVWIRPYGYSDSIVQQKIGEYKYIVDRTTDSDNDSFSSASFANGHYTVGGSLWLESSDLTTANNKFDSVVKAGGIYHIMMHPRNINWSTGWQLQHLDYIKGKTNIWYVGFGHLYLYHYIDDQNKVSVTKIRKTTGSYNDTNNPIIQLKKISRQWLNFLFILIVGIVGFLSEKEENTSKNLPNNKAD